MKTHDRLQHRARRRNLKRIEELNALRLMRKRLIDRTSFQTVQRSIVMLMDISTPTLFGRFCSDGWITPLLSPGAAAPIPGQKLLSAEAKREYKAMSLEADLHSGMDSAAIHRVQQQIFDHKLEAMFALVQRGIRL